MTTASTQADQATQFSIFVNTRKRVVKGPELTFAQVVALSELPGGENTIFTVSYYTPTGNVKGSLTEGESVKLIEGMVFNVTPTDKS